METVKKKLWTAVFVLIAVTFVFNFIYQIVLLNYQSVHSYGDPYFQNFFRHMRFGSILGIILNVAGIAGAIFMVYCVQKKKNVDKVMFGSLLLATVPLKSVINLLSIHSSFSDMYSFFNGSIPYSSSFLLVLVAIVSFAAVGLSLLCAFLKNFKSRHVLTATGVIASIFITLIYVPLIPVPRIGGDVNFYFNGGEIIMGLVHLVFAAVATAMFASLSSPNFEKKYRMSAQARGIKIPEDPKPVSSNVSNSSREANIKNAMEQYGMTREEAELLYPEEVEVKVPSADERREQLMQEASRRSNNPNIPNMPVGLGLPGVTPINVPSSEPKPQVDNSAEIAELKRQLLQGKITRAEFDEKLAEIKNR